MRPTLLKAGGSPLSKLTSRSSGCWLAKGRSISTAVDAAVVDMHTGLPGAVLPDEGPPHHAVAVVDGHGVRRGVFGFTPSRSLGQNRSDQGQKQGTNQRRRLATHGAILADLG